MLAEIGSTFANLGVNPTTNSQIFGSDVVKKVLSVMFSCGMGQFSGQWEFHVGIPAIAALNSAVLAGDWVDIEFFFSQFQNIYLKIN